MQKNFSSKEQAKETGIYKFQDLFSVNEIAALRALIEEDVEGLTHDFPDFLSRFSYNLSSKVQIKISEIVESLDLLNKVQIITQKELFLSQEIYFELKKGVSHGFPWHVGTYSFGAQQIDDYGCSLWIPFVSLEAELGGGITCVPKDKLSGKFVYEYIEPAVINDISKKIEEGESISYLDYLDLKHQPLNTGYFLRFLESHAVSLDFRLGDALLFDKYIIHRSNKIQDNGPDYRGALVLRFMDKKSTYSKKGDETRHYHVTKFSASPYLKRNLNSLKDGQLLLTSEYFNNRISS